MTVLAWIVVGLIAGLIATTIVNHRRAGVALDTLLGVAGAVVGGLTFSALAAVEITRFGLWTLLVAVFGAALVLAAYHAASRRRVA